MIDVMWWFDRITNASFIASGVVNLLPDSRLLNGYPRAQKVYATTISIVAATALNIRAQLPALAVPILGFKQCPSCGGSSLVKDTGSGSSGSSGASGNQTLGSLKPGDNPYLSSVPPSGTPGSGPTNPKT